MHIENAQYREDFGPIEKDCGCSTYAPRKTVNGHWSGYSRAYVAHLLRAHELFAYQLTSIHNMYFIINLVKKARQAIFDGTFVEYKNSFFDRYYKK